MASNYSYTQSNQQWQNPLDQSGAQSWDLATNQTPLGQSAASSAPQSYYTHNMPLQAPGAMVSSSAPPLSDTTAPQTGWQQQAGWQKGGSMLGFGANTQQQSPYYVPAQHSYGSNYNKDPYSGAQQDVKYPPRNQLNKQDFRSSFPRQSNPRPPQIPQAEVFRMANERIISRMKGPTHRQRGPGQGKKNFQKKGPPTNAPKQATIPGPVYTPTQLVNRKELAGITWESKSFPNDSGSRVVYVSMLNYQGAQYNGIGRTKLDAMNDAAKYFLKSLGDPVPHYEEESPAASTAVTELHQLLQAKKSNTKLDFVFTLQGPPFECSVVFGGFTYNGIAATKKLAKAAAAMRVLDSLNAGQIEVPANTEVAGGISTVKSAVGELTKRVAGAAILDWVMEAAKSNTTNLVMHTAYLTIDGRQFIGQDVSKKAAKNAVATQILQAADNQTLVLPTPPKKELKRSADAMEAEAAGSSDEPDAKKKAGAVMSPLTQISRLYPRDMITWTFEGTGPSHQPQFTAIAAVQGKTYTGAAGSKKEAKTIACNHILKATDMGLLEPFKPSEPKPRPEKKRKTEKMEAEPTPVSNVVLEAAKSDNAENYVSKATRVFGSLNWESEKQGTPHDPLFVMRVTLSGKAFSGVAGNKKDAKQLCCKDILAAVESGEIQPDKDGQTSAPSSSTVGKLFPSLSWGFKAEGAVHQALYTVTCIIEGIIFEGQAKSKKLAKKDACDQILVALEEGKITKPKPVTTSQSPFSSAMMRRFSMTFGQPELLTQKTGSDESPEYHVSTTVEGKAFDATGSSEDEAKSNIVSIINAALAAKEIEIPLMTRFQRRFRERKIKVEFTGTDVLKEYTATFENNGDIFTEKSTEGVEDAERKVAQTVLDSVTHSGKLKRKRTSDEAIPINVNKTPVQLLNEKNPSAKIDVELVGDPKGAIPFIAKAVVDGHAFQGSGQSKMSAKHNCAAVILAEMYGHHFESVGRFNQPQTEDDMMRGDIGDIDPQCLSTTVQTLIRTKFTEIIGTVESRFNGRKVLGGCVMVKGSDLETAELIAVTTGTKCISGSNMSHTGKVVNDMHAEVLVRRAMKNYLYKQLELAKTSQQSVLVPTSQTAGPKYRLADDVRFHLYISSPPCGDSRIFIASTTKEGEDTVEQMRDTNPARANRGQLRVKIEAGMGTIPVKGEYERIQSWEAIMSGERYLNMSCCDKVARWALLGVQGSLLSSLLAPVYFSSVIVGSMFNQEHIYRGLYGRVKDLQTLGEIHPPFLHYCPEIIGTIAPELRNTAKPPIHALIWQAIDDSTELLDTRNGLMFDKKASSLCKASLFKQYRKANAGNPIPTSYDDAKAAATEYQSLKKRLNAALTAKGLGKWVSKPAEQDMFEDQTPAEATIQPKSEIAMTPVSAANPVISTPDVKAPSADTTPQVSASPGTRSGRRTRGKPNV